MAQRLIQQHFQPGKSNCLTLKMNLDIDLGNQIQARSTTEHEVSNRFFFALRASEDVLDTRRYLTGVPTGLSNLGKAGDLEFPSLDNLEMSRVDGLYLFPMSYLKIESL